MKKSNIIVVLLGLGILVFLFWLLFFHDNPQADKSSKATNSSTTTTNDSQSTSSQDATNNELDSTQNQQLQVFIHDFVQKYLTYDSSKPMASIDSVKSIVSTTLYNDQKQYLQKTLTSIKSIQVQNVTINSIDAGQQLTTANVSASVTVITKQNQTINTTYQYNFTLSYDQSGWKVVSDGNDYTTNE